MQSQRPLFEVDDLLDTLAFQTSFEKEPKRDDFLLDLRDKSEQRIRTFCDLKSNTDCGLNDVMLPLSPMAQKQRSFMHELTALANDRFYAEVKDVCRKEVAADEVLLALPADQLESASRPVMQSFMSALSCRGSKLDC